MSKGIKSKLAIIRIVFFILLSLLFFLLGFATSDRRFAERKGRGDIIFEQRISPKGSRLKSKNYAKLSTQESKGEFYYE